MTRRSHPLLKAGLGSARSYRRLQLVGQGSQHLVELGVSQSLALLSSPAAPQKPHLEIGEEELQDLRLLLEAYIIKIIILSLHFFNLVL